MSRVLKIAAVVVVVVAVLALAVAGTIHAFGAGQSFHCNSGNGVCGQGQQADCDSCGNCGYPHDCSGAWRCNSDCRS